LERQSKSGLGTCSVRSVLVAIFVIFSKESLTQRRLAILSSKVPLGIFNLEKGELGPRGEGWGREPVVSM
jgi:hypothetical protein